MTHMRKNQGLFSVPVYITSGDPYVKKEEGNSRLRGMQFKTNPQKRGQTADNWGNKKRDFKPLYEQTPGGEPYFAANEKEMRIANEQRKKCLQPDGFKYSSPTKMQCSTGDNFGCFGKWSYMEPFNPVKKGDPHPEIKEVPPNIKTNPIKKGSYGANGSAGKWKAMIGVPPPYMPEPSKEAQAKITADRLAHEAAMLGRAPFRSMSKTLDFFDGQKFCAASKIYTPSGPVKPLEPKAPAPADDRKPFYPSRIPKTGYNSTLNRFPEYVADNFMERQKMEREAAAAQRAKIVNVFKPGGNAKALTVKPVMTHPMNIEKVMDLSLPAGSTFEAGLGAGA